MVENLVLLTPAYTAFQARIAIGLQSVTVSITSPLRTHRGAFLYFVEHLSQLGVKIHVFVVCPKSRPTDYVGVAGLTHVAVAVASQMVRTEGDSYLKSLFL